MNPDFPIHNMATATVASMKLWKRKPADFYPTPYEATFGLLGIDPPPREGRIKEPACGDGAISRCLIAAGYDVDSSDLRRTGYGDEGVDFLQDCEDAAGIMTNPPFSIAADFIRQAVEHAPWCAMLLKSNYWHTKSRLKLYRDHPPAGIYPLTWRLAFLAEERGTSPLMDCTWYVWREGPLRHEPIERPKSFPYVEPPGILTRLIRFEDELDLLTEALRGRRE